MTRMQTWTQGKDSPFYPEIIKGQVLNGIVYKEVVNSTKRFKWLCNKVRGQGRDIMNIFLVNEMQWIYALR